MAQSKIHKRLSPRFVNMIRYLGKRQVTYSELAHIFSISERTASSIVREKSYSNVIYPDPDDQIKIPPAFMQKLAVLRQEEETRILSAGETPTIKEVEPIAPPTNYLLESDTHIKQPQPQRVYPASRYNNAPRRLR